MKMVRTTCSTVLLFGLWPVTVVANDAVRSFVNTYCLDCHSGDDAERGFELDAFGSVGRNLFLPQIP